MRTLVLLTFLAAFALLTGAATSIAYASQPSQGYVQYSVTLNSTQPSTFTVNESVTQTSQKGFDDIGLAISSTNTNLTLSRILNVSSFPEIFPYLPGINGTYSFQSHGIAISASIQNTGTSSVSFHGDNYQVTNYAISVTGTNSSSGKSGSLSGVFSSMPSGLLYSAQVKFNDTLSANVQLLATNLPLVSSTSSLSSATIGVAIVGASVFGAVALAVPALFKRAKNSSKNRNDVETKPDYWVD